MTKKTNNYIEMELEVSCDLSNFPGIYCIKNLSNGKIYIGSSKDVYKRCSGHFERLRKQTHENPYLQASFNKYGTDSFKAYFIKGCKEEYLFELEQIYLDNLHPEYNINKLATGRRGMKMPEEVVKKLIIRKQKKVNQYDYNNNLLNSFPSLTSVYSHFGIKKTGGLTDHLKGKLRTFKGYFFAYDGEKPIIRKKRSAWLKRREKVI